MKNFSIRTEKFQKCTAGSLPVLMVLAILAFTYPVNGQTLYKITDGTLVKVSGTSNLHDWTMLSKSSVCEGNFVVKDGTLQAISSLNFSLPVATLKSKDDLMDTRAHKTLKAAQFNKITFKLIEATVLPQQKMINAVGNLTIGGVTNKTTLQVTYVLTNDKSLIFKGSKLIKMSDHKIKAPSFMLGALKTGDEVTIDLLLKFKKSDIIPTNNNTK
ncbi:MAG: YceI family protein [Flavobacterium sp.]|nr:YceI family protein [Pedobacter sp.]